MRTLSTTLCLSLSILLAVLFTASATAILIQISRTSPKPGLRSNWDALTVGLSYIALAVLAFSYYVGRTLKSRRKLARISYLDSSGSDATPKSVQKYIAGEYSRACAIAYHSLPKVASREGWGSPGTSLEGIRFRRALIDTLLPMDGLARDVIPHLPPLRPHESIISHFVPIAPLVSSYGDDDSCLSSYAVAIENARHRLEEPTEAEFLQGMQAAGQLSRLLEEYTEEMQGESPSLRSS